MIDTQGTIIEAIREMTIIRKNILTLVMGEEVREETGEAKGTMVMVIIRKMMEEGMVMESITKEREDRITMMVMDLVAGGSMIRGITKDERRIRTITTTTLENSLIARKRKMMSWKR